MKLNRLFFVITVLSMGSLLQAMKNTVTLPSAAKITKCLEKKGFKDLAEQTNIAQNLGGKETTLVALEEEVGEHIGNFVTKNPKSSLIWAYKQDIINCILQQ